MLALPAKTHRNTAALRAAALAFALCLTACQTTPLPQTGTNALPADAGLPPQITAAPGMQRWVHIGAITTATNAGGLLTAQIPISASANQHRSIDYRFEWLDANGQAIPTVLSRDMQLHLYPGATQTLSGIAPTPSAQDFRLHLKPSP